MAAADSPSRVQISRNAVFSDEIFRSGRAADKLAQITETSASLPDSLLRSSLSLMRVLERGTLGTVEDGQYVQTGPQDTIQGRQDLREVAQQRQLSRQEYQLAVQQALQTAEQDAQTYLAKIESRMMMTGVKPPTAEVRFQDLTVQTTVYAELSRILPSVMGFYRECMEGALQRLFFLRPKKRNLVILNRVNGALQPGRITLLLGPPASGKSTLLKALAGALSGSGLKVTGNISYNGRTLKEFLPRRTATFVEQSDTHIGELTVRETLNFAARCQGAGLQKKLLSQMRKREGRAGYEPDAAVDTLMQLEALEGLPTSVRTELMISMLGLGICADTMVGDAMHRGVSGGQKKRVTSGEMLVGQKRVLFMDEPSTGLDSSTTYCIIKYLRDLTHTQQSTTLISLLQPDPETFALFDDVLVLAEGHVIYHGPVAEAAGYFGELSFACPERKGIADFLQEVTSEKDQKQYFRVNSGKPYWYNPSKSHFVTAAEFAELFRTSHLGQAQLKRLTTEIDPRQQTANDAALVQTDFAASSWQQFKACWDRELILVRRNLPLYCFRFFNTVLVSLITAFTFFRGRLHPTDLIAANRYISVLFFSMLILIFDASTEMVVGLNRLPGFYKQRDNKFYASWAFVLPTTLMRLPYSLLVAIVWSTVVYWVVGLAPDISRYFYFICLVWSLHSLAVAMFRSAAALAREPAIASSVGALLYLMMLMCGGFLLSKGRMPAWWAWFYWANPLAYAQKALCVNEFDAPRWQEIFAGGLTVGEAILMQRDLPVAGFNRWLGLGAVVFAWALLNVETWLAYAYLNPIGRPAAVLPQAIREEIKKDHAAEKLDGKLDGKLHGCQEAYFAAGKADMQLDAREDSLTECSSSVVQAPPPLLMPFEPLTLTFRHLSYYIPMPKTMDTTDPNKLGPQPVEVGGVQMLRLLDDCSGAFRPGILTALIGSSGAGKTTLMDVLACRKTTGMMSGDVRISGHQQEAASFRRVSGYVEQFDIHSPRTTVGEALWMSARLRFGRDVSNATVRAFILEVQGLVELDNLAGSLVGEPGKTGLSVEQRKRLTIAVELVANPSIIFMDEPTSGLDARAAAIVMRTIRRSVDSGRTVVCTIHQPSIDIFEAFDDLLLMKVGGSIIYHGEQGVRSAKLIAYFESIPGVPLLRAGLNPATWMLQITTPGVERLLGVDFAAQYLDSSLYREVDDMIDRLEVPPQGSAALQFNSAFAQPQAVQFWLLLRRNHTSYSRNPSYNATRFLMGAGLGLLFGSFLWQLGQERSTLQDLNNILGSLYIAMIFLSFLNSLAVQAVVATERGVFYREQAAGMYSSLPFGLACCVVELPYILVQNAIFCTISYWMIGFEPTAIKFFWYLLIVFLNIFLVTNYGIMGVFATPSPAAATIFSSMWFSLWNLFAGFIVPRALIPPWFRWYTYLDPIHWSLYGLVASQLGDVQDPLFLGPGLPQLTVEQFLDDYYDYQHSFLPWVAVILLGYGIAFAFFGVLALRICNYQKR